MFRKICRNLHRWIGLLVSPVIVVVSLTGALLVFEDEIRSLGSCQFAETRDSAFLPPSVLERIARQSIAAPDSAWQARVDYRGTGLSAAVILFGRGSLYNVYLNPCTGEVLKTADQSRDFFRIVKSGHRTLWLGKTGKTIVGVAVFLFVPVLLTGLVLWFPHRPGLQTLRGRLLIRRGTSAAKRVYDLHNVPGFYLLPFALLLALSGLLIAFPGLGGPAPGAFHSPGRTPQPESAVPGTWFRQTDAPFQPQDSVAAMLFASSPRGRELALSLLVPTSGNAPIWAIVNPGADGTVEGAETRFRREFRYFDRHTLRELPVSRPENRPFPEASGREKLLRMNYDLHTGRIGSIYTKLLAFAASLVCASLPVTGFLLWRRRTRLPRMRRV